MRIWTQVVYAILAGSFVAPKSLQSGVFSGNGHYFTVVSVPAGITWENARLDAESRGGYLATITTQSESDFVGALVNDPSYWTCDVGPGSSSIGPWIGGKQSPTAAEPSAGWSWITGEPWIFTNWEINQPNNTPIDSDYLHLYRAQPCPTPGDKWNDNGNIVAGAHQPVAYVLEREIEAVPVPRMWIGVLAALVIGGGAALILSRSRA